MKGQIYDHTFGIDRIECFAFVTKNGTDIYNTSTGELLISEEQLANLLGIFSETSTKVKEDNTKRLLSKYTKEVAELIVDFSSESTTDQKKVCIPDSELASLHKSELAIMHREVGKSLKGSMKHYPIAIALKQDRLNITFNMATIVDQHNGFSTKIEQLQERLNEVSNILGFKITNFFLRAIEYALDITTDQSIESVVNSLGAYDKKKNTRNAFEYGARWIDLPESSTIQVYSKYHKNQEYARKQKCKKSKELTDLYKQGKDSVRFEFKKKYRIVNPNHTLSDLYNPEFLVTVLKEFKKEINKINALEFNLLDVIKKLDLTSLGQSIHTPTDQESILQALGFAIMQKVLPDIISRKRLKNKKRFNNHLDRCQKTLKKISSEYSGMVHIKEQILSVLAFYIQVFQTMINIL